MNTPRAQSAFPIVARIRKGGPKGEKTIGKDLNDRFRFDFYPGFGDVQAAFYAVYGSYQPQQFRALIPDLTPFNGTFTWFNQAFLTRQVACADDHHYLWLIDPETGKYVVRDGEPFRPFIPKDEIPWKTASGKDLLLKVKSVMFLDLLLYEVAGHFVSFELYSTSYYDRVRVEAQLRAIQGIANIIANGNVGTIPLLVRRSEREITWTKGAGGTRLKKWLIDIGPDPTWAEKVGFPKLREVIGDTAAASIMSAPAEQPVQGELNPDDEDDENGLPEQKGGEVVEGAALLEGHRDGVSSSKGAAHDDGLEKVFDRVVLPWRFVRIPKALFVVEVNPGDDLPEDVVKSLYETGQMPPQDGAWEASVSLNSLIFALFAQAVADMRRVHEAHKKRGVVESDALRDHFPVWQRGRIASSAGFLMDFAGIYDIPRPAFSLARQVLQAETAFLDEILAAGIAGAPWQKDLANECLRCGQPASWRAALSAPGGMPVEAAWRYLRPENAAPFCNKCAARLGWNQSESVRLDAVWGLWGMRFEALWQWHRAWQENTLPPWDRYEHPLWPCEFGGDTWADGSGAVMDASPRPPKGVRRLKRHQDALARTLSAGPACTGRPALSSSKGHQKHTPSQLVVH